MLWLVQCSVKRVHLFEEELQVQPLACNVKSCLCVLLARSATEAGIIHDALR
jgi:hypothetical protein